MIGPRLAMPIHRGAPGWAPATSAGRMAEMRRRDNIGKKEPRQAAGAKVPLRGPI